MTKTLMHQLTAPRMILMLTVVALSAPASLLAGTPSDERPYWVTLQQNAAFDGTRAVADEMAASYRGTVVTGEAGEGAFVIRLAESRARVLATDPRVKSVVPMRLRSAPQNTGETVSWSNGVSYSYDGVGNVTQIGNDTFVYDKVSRLVQGTVNGIQRSYGYDAFGNRTACTQLGPNDCQALTINASQNKNRIAESSYDAAGNMLTQWGHNYTYDALNMMTRDDGGVLPSEFVYTADDERIATYTVGLSWRWTIRETSGQILRELTSQDGPGGAAPRRITDDHDHTVGFHDYHAFGPETPGALNEPSLAPLKYTGHERDNAANQFSDTLDYMHARYYSPALGRFLSIDAHTGNPHTPASWNRYSYARNDPMRLIDPDGRAAREAIIRLTVTVFYDANTVDRPRLFGNPPLRKVVEESIPRARTFYAHAGIALAFKRLDVDMVTAEGSQNWAIRTPTGRVRLQDVAKQQTGLSVFVSNNFSTGGSTVGVGGPTFIGNEAVNRVMFDELGHALGNTMPIRDVLRFFNAIADTRIDLQELFIDWGRPNLDEWFEKTFRDAAERYAHNNQNN